MGQIITRKQWVEERIKSLNDQMKPINDWLMTNHASIEWGEKYKEKTSLLNRRIEYENELQQMVLEECKEIRQQIFNNRNDGNS